MTDRHAFSAHHSGFIEIIVNKCQFLLGVLCGARRGGALRGEAQRGGALRGGARRGGAGRVCYSRPNETLGLPALQLPENAVAVAVLLV